MTAGDAAELAGAAETSELFRNGSHPRADYAGTTSDGQYAVSSAGYAPTGEPDRTLRFWRIDSGKCLRVIAGQLKPITSVAISGNGQFTSSPVKTHLSNAAACYSSR